MRFFTPFLFAIFLLANGPFARARQIDPSTPPPPPPAEGQPVASEPTHSQPIDPSTPPPPPPAEAPVTPPEPAFDPLHAQRDVEVGTFYLDKGNYDAAIDRLEEATHYEPALARPWELMGEAYEKKHDSSRAVGCYKKYLEIFPHAKDADKIRKRIGELEEKTPQQASKPTTP